MTQNSNQPHGSADVLTDGMRGRSSVWYRLRVRSEATPEIAAALVDTTGER